MRVLVDATANFTITEEARAYSAERAAKTRIAIAFLIRSAATRLLVNLYTKINKPKVPTRMFTDEQSAIKWLDTFNG